MKTVTKLLATGSALTALLLFFACNKNTSSSSNSNIPPGKSQVSIYMMDDPIQFAKVLIDIRQVVVEIDTATKQTDEVEGDQHCDNYWVRQHDECNKSDLWVTLSITTGVSVLLTPRT